MRNLLLQLPSKGIRGLKYTKFLPKIDPPVKLAHDLPSKTTNALLHRNYEAEDNDSVASNLRHLTPPEVPQDHPATDRP